MTISTVLFEVLLYLNSGGTEGERPHDSGQHVWVGNVLLPRKQRETISEFFDVTLIEADSHRSKAVDFCRERVDSY